MQATNESKHVDSKPAVISMLQDSITQEDSEFRSYTHFGSKHPQILLKVSLLSAFFSLYELIYSCLSLYSSLTSIMAFLILMGIVSLSSSIILFIWSIKMQNIDNSTWENFNRKLWLALIFRAASSTVLIPAIIMQREHLEYHLKSLETNFGIQFDSISMRMFKSMGAFLPVVEILITLAVLLGAKVCFKYINQPTESVSSLIYVSNLLLMGSSLTLILKIGNVQDDWNDFELSDLFPVLNLTTLSNLGACSAVMVFFIWLVNFKGWRVPRMAVCCVMTMLLVGLTICSVYGYRHVQHVRRFFSDTLDLNILSEKLMSIDKSDIEEIGCPSKYLSIPCDLNSEVIPWESETSPNSCLNLACGSLLGVYHENIFLKVLIWASVSFMSCLLILIGKIYLCWNIRDLGTHKKKGYIWLGILAIMILIFLSMSILHTRPYINDKNFEDLKLENILKATPKGITLGEAKENKLLALQERIDNTQQVLIGEMGTSLGLEVFNMVTNPTYRFMIQRYNKTLRKIELADTGSWDKNYKDFLKKISPKEAQIGFIYFNIDNTDELVLIIYAPKDQYPNPTIVYKMFSLPSDPYKLRILGNLHVYVARSMKDLQVGNVLKYISEDQFIFYEISDHPPKQAFDDKIASNYQDGAIVMLNKEEIYTDQSKHQLKDYDLEDFSELDDYYKLETGFKMTSFT